MFKKLLNWLTPKSSSELEAYIVSKNPQSVQEVEQLTQGFVWARGL